MANPNEQRLATALVERLSREQVACHDIPTGPQKTPDCRFVDSRGHEYVVEVTRLLWPPALAAYNFVVEKVSRVLEPDLGGPSYILYFRPDLFPGGLVSRADANGIVNAVRAQLALGSLPEPFTPLPGYEIRPSNSQGSWIEPWPVVPDLAYDIVNTDPAARALQDGFEAMVEEADEKLQNWSGRRILLVDIAQSGLDEMFHAVYLKGPPPLLAAWADALVGRWPEVEEVYLEPGVPVWTSAMKGGSTAMPWHAVRAPTRFAGQPRGVHIQMRPPPMRLV